MSDLDELLAKRDKLVAQSVLISIQIVAMLVVPIGVVIYSGKILNELYNIGNLSVFVASITTLAFSWISVLKIYIRIDTQMRGLDAEIKNLKIKEGYDPSINKKRQEMYDKSDNEEKGDKK